MANYIKYIRNLVGSNVVIFVGVCVIIFDDQRRILMQQRSDNRLWCCPGGMVEVDEVVEDTGRREVREETGLIISQLSLVGILSGPQRRFIYPNGDDTSNVTILFATRVPGMSQLVANHESIKLQWFDIETVENDLGAAVASAEMFKQYDLTKIYDQV